MPGFVSLVQELMAGLMMLQYVFAIILVLWLHINMHIVQILGVLMYAIRFQRIAFRCNAVFFWGI